MTLTLNLMPIKRQQSPVLVLQRAVLLGGTQFVLTGTMFTGEADDKVPVVTIDGVSCAVSAFDATQVTCETGAGCSLYSDPFFYFPILIRYSALTTTISCSLII